MHYRFLAVLLLASVAVGQAPSATPPSPAPPSGAESVAPETPVITIEGMCDTPKTTAAKTAVAKKTDCKTVVTRAQFDALANALQPNMNAATKRKLADLYPKMLIMAHTAKERGLENDPKFKQILQFARLQILSQELSRSMKEDADKVPAAEIEKYYKDNAAAFEQVSLLHRPRNQAEGDGEGRAREEK